MNRSLSAAPLCTLACFVVCDAGSALLLLLMFDASGVVASADFALAYALMKGVVRAPRLALDAAAAALLARLCPPLAAVRVSLLIEAAAEAGRRLRRAPAVSATAPSPSSRVLDEARRLADAYGLAYMAAKNVIGPVSILLTYALLSRGVDLQTMLGATGLGAAGRMAGLMALASTASTLLFPAVVLAACWLSLRVSSLLPRAQHT
jgi:hypothetical protein